VYSFFPRQLNSTAGTIKKEQLWIRRRLSRREFTDNGTDRQLDQKHDHQLILSVREAQKKKVQWQLRVPFSDSIFYKYDISKPTICNVEKIYHFLYMLKYHQVNLGVV
jgi:hypothetical protein